MKREFNKLRAESRQQWRRLGQWVPGILFWSFQVALTSAVVALSDPTLTTQGSLGRSFITWGVWALLAPLIVGLDRWLTLSRDAIFKRFLIHIPFSLVFTASSLYLDAAIHALLKTGLRPFPPPRDELFRVFQNRFFVYWMLLLIYLTLDYTSNIRRREVRTSELERLLSQARLEALRARLNPHFLFNALNTISAKVEREPRTARRMIEQLGELLRMAMASDSEQEIPLGRELAFIDRYFDLLKMRFEERLDTCIDVDSDLRDALVPALILQPLVENAIRYGTAARMERSSVGVRAWRKDDNLFLQVQDNGPGLPPDWDSDSHSGIGISSTRERLRRLYGDRDQSFEIHSEPQKGVRVNLTLPFHCAKNLCAGPIEEYGQYPRIRHR